MGAETNSGFAGGSDSSPTDSEFHPRMAPGMFQPDSSVSAAAPFDGFRPQRPRAASMMAQDVVQKIAEEGRAQLQAEFHPQFNMMPPSEMESQPPSDTEARAEGPAQEEDNARQAQPQPDELQQSVNDEMRQSHG